jgi:hypothetical protein
MLEGPGCEGGGHGERGGEGEAGLHGLGVGDPGHEGGGAPVPWVTRVIARLVSKGLFKRAHLCTWGSAR